ncbi:hypothetical protein FIBSPDRAFT_868446 [Athelia psychrophila]|uniref:Uncharacterized protein n=1 Tax=Athelia psychrophila TaxID=1759441 RepID=A0A166D222_9AGAM|nr:hypothetical protein FIBSPDRAFT_868446 [Fibularhizoctonia sp. CBS 109695]
MMLVCGKRGIPWGRARRVEAERPSEATQMGRCRWGLARRTSQTNTPTAKSKKPPPTPTPSPHPSHIVNLAHPIVVLLIFILLIPPPPRKLHTGQRAPCETHARRARRKGRRRSWDERGTGQAEEDVGGRCYL